MNEIERKWRNEIIKRDSANFSVNASCADKRKGSHFQIRNFCKQTQDNFCKNYKLIIKICEDKK